jgi:uncharacterized membrane protein YdbT with pleckstrin-like domain
MSYINKILRKDETVVFETKFHWFKFIIPLLITLIIILNVKFSLETLNISKIHFYLIAIPASYTIYRFIEWLTSEFAVTNRRVIIKYGFIFRQTFEIFNVKIEGCDIYQGLFGRLFNFGIITINGTGSTRQKMKYVRDPIKFRDSIYEEVENLRKNKDS